MDAPRAKRRKTDWSDQFDPGECIEDRDGEIVVYHHAYHGNSKDTRVAIVSETPEKEWERVESLKSDHETSEIQWKVFHFQGIGETVIKEVIDWGSTNLVINIEKSNRKMILNPKLRHSYPQTHRTSNGSPHPY